MAEPHALDLTVERGADGRSRLIRKRVAFPWSLGRAFAPISSDDPLLILPQAAGAGLVAGDDVHQAVTLDADTAARLESAGATVVHGGSGSLARSHWTFSLSPSSALVVAAEPYVLAPDADLHLTTQIDIAPDAVFIGFEGMCHAVPPDGTASRGSWRTDTRVFRPDGEILLIDRQRAEAGDPARLSALPFAPAAFGTIFVLAPPDRLTELETGPIALPEVYAAATPLRKNAGIGIRIAAPTGGRLRDAGMMLLNQLVERLGLLRGRPVSP